MKVVPPMYRNPHTDENLIPNTTSLFFDLEALDLADPGVDLDEAAADPIQKKKKFFKFSLNPRFSLEWPRLLVPVPLRHYHPTLVS